MEHWIKYNCWHGEEGQKLEEQARESEKSGGRKYYKRLRDVASMIQSNKTYTQEEKEITIATIMQLYVYGPR